MPHTTCTAGHHDSERNLTVTVCAEEGRSHRRRRRCKSDDRRSTKRALSQKSEQLASTHVALLDSERREALLDHELAHQRNTHAKLNKQIKHLKNEVQKTEILLHEVLEGVWQKEVASQDTRAGAQDHNSAHEQAINKAADSIHGIGKLGMMFIFSFAVSWSLVLLDRQEYVEVPRLAKENRKNAHNPGTQTCVATEGRSVKSALSFLTLMCEIWQIHSLAIGGSMSNSVVLQDRSQTCKPTHQQNNGGKSIRCREATTRSFPSLSSFHVTMICTSTHRCQRDMSITAC